jgi:hypothetical protein
MDQTLLVSALCVAAIALSLFHPRVFTRPLSNRLRWILGLLQLVPLLILVWLLGNPLLESRRSVETERITLLVVDDSPSMTNPDGSSSSSRIDSIRSWIETLDGLWPSTGAKTPPPVLYLSQLVRAGRSGSDFAEAFAALGRRYPEGSLGGIVLVSDGRDHSVQEVLSVARRLQVPIHPVGIGPTLAPNSLIAKFQEVPDSAQPGSPFLAQWSLDSTFDHAQPVSVRIDFASQEVFFEEIELREGNDRHDNWISVTPVEPGDHVLVLKIETEDETAPASVARATVTVEETPPTLLVLESAPSKDVRSLTQAALDSGRYRVVRPVSSPSGGVVVWDLFRPLPGLEAEASFPWKHEEMRRFSQEEWEGEIEEVLSDIAVVILGDRPWQGLSIGFPGVLEDFFAESRAGVLALPGSEKERERLPEGSLSALLEWMGKRGYSPSPLQLRFPEDAAQHPALAPLWSELEKTRRVGPDSFFEETPPVRVPLVFDIRERPLVYSIPFGLGRSTSIAPSNLWSIAAFSGDSEDRRFLEGFWLGILDDLSSEKRARNLSVEVDPKVPTVGRQATIRVRDPSLRPGPPEGGLQIRKSSENWRNLVLSPDPTWRGIGDSVWIPRSAGTYEIRYASGGTTLRIEVVDRPEESEDVTQNPAFLRSLAEATGGNYYEFQDRANALAAIRPESRTVVRTEKSPLRHDAKWGALVAVLFCAGWGVRRALSLP